MPMCRLGLTIPSTFYALCECNYIDKVPTELLNCPFIHGIYLKDSNSSNPHPYTNHSLDANKLTLTTEENELLKAHMRDFRKYSNFKSLWKQEWSLHGNKFGLSETEFFRSLLRLGVPACKKINDLLLLIVKNEQVNIRGAWVGLKAQKLHDKLLHVVGEHALQCQRKNGVCYLRQILLMYFVYENQFIQVDNRYGSQNGRMAWNLGCNLGDIVYFHQKDLSKEKNDEDRGACKKCGRVGHSTFQCRNFLSVKEDEKDQDLIQVNVLAGLQKSKGRFRKVAAESGEKSSEASSKLKSTKKKKDSSDDEDSDSGRRKKRGRSKKRRSGKRSGTDSDDENDVRRKRRKEKRRKKDESSDEEEECRKRKRRKEKRRRRSHRHADDSDDTDESLKRRKRKSRRSGKRSGTDSDDENDVRRKRRKEKRRKKDESSDEEEECRKRKRRKEKRRRRSHRHADDSDDTDESLKRRKRKSRRARSPSVSNVSDSEDSRIGRHSKRSDKKSQKRTYEDDD